VGEAGSLGWLGAATRSLELGRPGINENSEVGIPLNATEGIKGVPEAGVSLCFPTLPPSNGFCHGLISW
jgi:hypothetical protein